MSTEKKDAYRKLLEEAPQSSDDNLCNVSGYSLEQRQALFYMDMAGLKPRHENMETYEFARERAHDEMMNEQQIMLIAICKHLGIKVGVE